VGLARVIGSVFRWAWESATSNHEALDRPERQSQIEMSDYTNGRTCNGGSFVGSQEATIDGCRNSCA
jgi:hypothetical protein